MVNDERLVFGDKFEPETVQSDDELGRMTELIRNFTMSVQSPETNRLCSSARENLQNMAVIESAYLSARTGFPEEPGRILQMSAPLAEEITEE